MHNCCIFFTIFYIFSPLGLSANNGISAKLIDSKALADSPRYPEGETALLGYLSNNIRYPHLLIKLEMEGEVQIKYTIEKDGSVNKIEIERGFDPLADDEVVRAVKAMPKWIAGTSDMVQHLVITFTLNDTLRNLAEQSEKEIAEEKKVTKEEEPKIEAIPDVIPDVIIPDDPLNKDPQFPGGREAMYAYFKKNIKYPKKALKLGIEGRVLFNVLISEKGEISKIALYKGVFYECNEEAFYLIKKMPAWTPGLKDGKPTAMEVLIPVPFELPK